MKNYKLTVFLIALIFSIFTNTSFANHQALSEINTNISDNWKLIKKENGIRVYIAQYESNDQTLAYKIKFENTTNKEANLAWSLINKGSKTTFSEKNTIIKANDSLIILNQQNPVSVRFGEKASDIQIKLNLK